MNCDNASLLLYAVTDRSWLHGQTLYAQAEQALQGGATFLQLREKELDEAHFKEEAIALKALCKQYGVPFVLDDNVALAIETDADGVHVGQSDMAAGKVRELIGPDKILGVSAQTVDELKNRIGNRYHKVNLEAYSRHKTVEFRQHSGTTNFTKMRNWVLFLHKLVTFATRGQVPTATALRNIPFLDDEQKLYYKLRTKKLSA